MGNECMQALERDEFPFDLRRGDIVTLADGRVGTTTGIAYGATWDVRLGDGTLIRVNRAGMTWTGKTDGLPNKVRR
jgi:preprotein translocase subunit YajC